MKNTVYLVLATISILFSKGYGQITITGSEHILHNYSESFGRNVTLLLNNDDVNNIFVIKDDKIKSVGKVFDNIEINGFIKNRKVWFVHGIETYKKRNYLHISQNNNSIYILLDGTDYVHKMRYYNIYNDLINTLNVQNIYLNRSEFSDNSTLPVSDKYLVCDTAYKINWTGHKAFNDTIVLYYSLVDKNNNTGNGIYSVLASSITKDKFVNTNFVTECLLHEQYIQDSIEDANNYIEDRRLHAFIVFQRQKSSYDTIFCYSSYNGWCRNNIQTIYEFSDNDIKTYAPNSSYSDMSYSEFVKYVNKRDGEGYKIRYDLAQKADAENSRWYIKRQEKIKQQEDEARQKEQQKRSKEDDNGKFILDKNFKISGKITYLSLDADLDNAANVSDNGLYFSITMENLSPHLRLYYPATKKTVSEVTFTGQYLYRTDDGYIIGSGQQIYVICVKMDGKWALVFYEDFDY